MARKGKPLNDQQVDQHREGYVRSTPAEMLDDAFSKWEDCNGLLPLPPMNRADHIIIGGRTATDLLLDEFNKQHPTTKGDRVSAYTNFYVKHGNRLVNELVAGALANGVNVEVFVPDKDTGKITDTPTLLTARGKVPGAATSKPKELNGWQRFWGKLGFYKKERQAVQEYEARQKVRLCNTLGRIARCSILPSAPYRAEMEKHQPDMVKEMERDFPKAKGDPALLGAAGGFMTDRTSFYTLAIDLLATKRDPQTQKFLYSNKQLYDMSDVNMQKARAAALKEVYDKYKQCAKLEMEKRKEEKEGKNYQAPPDREELEQEAKKSREWLAKLQNDSTFALEERVNAQVSSLDFSRPILADQEGYEEFAKLCETCFDQSQDMLYNSKAIDETYGPGRYSDLAAKIGGATQVGRHLNQAFYAQKHLLNNIPGTNQVEFCNTIAHVFKGQALQQEIARQLKGNPEKGFTKAVDVNSVGECNLLYSNAFYDDFAVREHRENQKPLPPLMEAGLKLAEEQSADPARFSKQIVNGTFGARLKAERLHEGGDLTLKVQTVDEAERQMQQTLTAAGPQAAL